MLATLVAAAARATVTTAALVATALVATALVATATIALTAPAAALAATTLAAVTTAALVATFAAAALAAALATTVATFAAFAATVTAATTLVISHTVFGFEGEARRTVGDRDQDTTPACEFIPFRACRRRRRNAFASDEFKAMSAFRRRNFTAGAAAGEFEAGWAFGAVLVEAGAASMVSAEAEAIAAEHCQGTAGAEGEESNRKERRQA